jgi:polysaccharide export outer membrane protein
VYSEARLRNILCCLLGAFAILACLRAQTVTKAEDRSTYTLGPDDQIVIRATHADEISEKPFRVQPDGCLNLPLIGKVEAGGLTLAEVEQVLTVKLKKYYVDPMVSVAITEFRSQPVSVLGAVAVPGVQQLQGRKTLIEIISAAGGPRTDAGPVIKITRDLQWGKIPLPFAHDDPKGKFSLAEVSLRDLLDSRDPTQNIAMRPDDVVTVPPGLVYYVMGEVKRPGEFVLGTRKSISVVEAYAMAMGPGPKAAPNKARILRGSDDPGGMREQIPVDVKKILAGKERDVALKPTDILYIPTNVAKNTAIRAVETAVQVGMGVMIYRF